MKRSKNTKFYIEHKVKNVEVLKDTYQDVWTPVYDENGSPLYVETQEEAVEFCIDSTDSVNSYRYVMPCFNINPENKLGLSVIRASSVEYCMV